MELKSGTELQDGRYRIVRTLGRGGFGITYLAEQVMAERKVCIKEFFPEEYYNRDANGCSISLGSQGSAKIMETFKAKFIKEAKTIAKFDHSNIIHIHDVFEENGTAYYVMEYIDGESLSAVVKRSGALGEAAAVGYIRQVAEALGYIHEQRIMHLDVKPGNVMLRSRDDRAILIDFGLSKHYNAESGEATSSSPVGVSHGFAPMEQYKSGGVKVFSPATDIYSLGATLYYLVTGLVPPEAADVSDEGLPALPAHLSQGVRTAIERSMADKRKARPQSIAEFLVLLDDNQPVAAPVAQPAAEVTVVNVETKKVSEATVISVETPAERSTPKSEPKSSPATTSAPSPKRGVGKWLWLVVFAIAAVVGFVVSGGGDKEEKSETVVEEADPLTAVVEEVEFTTPSENEESSAELCDEYAWLEPTNTVELQPLRGTINDHEWAELGLSVKWATCNVGATSPEDYGNYYAWGETTTKKYYTGNNSKTDGKSMSDISGNKEYDAATVNWGKGWRMPTKEEFEELLNEDNCTWEWTTQKGVKGYKVTSKKNYNSIFLPAAGFRYEGGTHYAGSSGGFWSSTPYDDTYNAYDLGFGNGGRGTNWSSRYGGLSVRPVAE